MWHLVCWQLSWLLDKPLPSAEIAAVVPLAPVVSVAPVVLRLVELFMVVAAKFDHALESV